MNNQHDRRYLQALRGALTAIAAAEPINAGVAMQAAISIRLLDRMIAIERERAQLEENFLRQLRGPLEELIADESALDPRDSHLTAESTDDLLRLMQAVKNHAFGEAMQLLGGVQRQLALRVSPVASRLSTTLLKLEADHARGVAAAVNAEHARGTVKGGAAALHVPPLVDPRALEAFIRSRFPQEVDLTVVDCRPLSGGHSKFTVGVALSGSRHFPSKIILRGDAGSSFGGAAVADEYMLITELYRVQVRVPRPLALEETGTIVGRPFALMEWRPGVASGNMYQLPEVPNRTLCCEAAEQLASIHRVPITELVKRFGARPVAARVTVTRWIDQAIANWRKLEVSSAVFEAAFGWLSRHLEVLDDASVTLVHGDYGMNNLLIEKDHVSAILDWEFAHVGNPAYDLAYFYPAAQRLASFEEFLQAYSRTGMPVPETKHLDYHRVLAATRIGVMVCQAAELFTPEAEFGVTGAAIIGGGYYEETISRISAALNRVC